MTDRGGPYDVEVTWSGAELEFPTTKRIRIIYKPDAFQVEWVRGPGTGRFDLLVRDATDKQVDRLSVDGARGPIERVEQDGRTVLDLIDPSGGPTVRVHMIVRQVGCALGEDSAAGLPGSYWLEGADDGDLPLVLESIDEEPVAAGSETTLEPLHGLTA